MPDSVPIQSRARAVPIYPTTPTVVQDSEHPGIIQSERAGNHTRISNPPDRGAGRTARAWRAAWPRSATASGNGGVASGRSPHCFKRGDNIVRLRLALWRHHQSARASLPLVSASHDLLRIKTAVRWTNSAPRIKTELAAGDREGPSANPGIEKCLILPEVADYSRIRQDSRPC